MRRLGFAVVLVALGANAQKHGKTPVMEDAGRVGVVTRVFHPAEPRNWRGAEKQELDAVVWYPAADEAVETRQYVGDPEHPLFEAGSAMPHAPFAPHLEPLPLVLLSHGTGGSAMQMAWLGIALARAGYIAVGVDHPGNNANGKLTAEGFALWWERATDLSDVLDAMLKDEEFGARIDKTRVAAAGYSLGGFTVLEVAGAQTEIAAFFDRCRPQAQVPQPDPLPNAKDRKNVPPPLTDDAAVCHVPEMRGLGSIDQILQATRKTSRESLARSGGSFKDARVKAVFAIAPALGFTMTQDSLHAIKVPVALVVGTEDRIAIAEENADYLRANIHGARENTLPGVGHYTFLDSCTAAGVKTLPQYCTEAPGVERDKVHAQVAAMVVGFFDRALKWR